MANPPPLEKLMQRSIWDFLESTWVDANEDAMMGRNQIAISQFEYENCIILPRIFGFEFVIEWTS